MDLFFIYYVYSCIYSNIFKYFQIFSNIQLYQICNYSTISNIHIYLFLFTTISIHNHIESKKDEHAEPTIHASLDNDENDDEEDYAPLDPIFYPLSKRLQLADDDDDVLPAKHKSKNAKTLNTKPSKEYQVHLRLHTYLWHETICSWLDCRTSTGEESASVIVAAKARWCVLCHACVYIYRTVGLSKENEKIDLKAKSIRISKRVVPERTLTKIRAKDKKTRAKGEVYLVIEDISRIWKFSSHDSRLISKWYERLKKI